MNDGTAPAPRISRAAIASRSAVVMPGSTASASTSRARDTTRPASRIAASWPGVLTWIGGSRLVPMAPPDSLTQRYPSPDEAPQRAEGAVGDLLHRPGGVDPEQDALVSVERDQRLGLLLVHVQPV